MDEFCYRTHLSGFRYLIQSRLIEHRVSWGLILLILYGSVAIQTYSTLLTYFSKDTVITIEETRETSSKSNLLLFPPIFVCHTGNFNKTFVRDNVKIPEEVLVKANSRGLSHDRLIDEFLRYMNLFSVFVYVGEFEPDVWELMNGIYDETFGGDKVHFSDFVVDSIHRDSLIFHNCQFNRMKFRCITSTQLVDLASCYVLFFNRTFHGVQTSTVGMENAFKFEMSLNMTHVADHWNDAQAYGIDEMGVRITLSTNPGPLESPPNFPANTQAIIRLKQMKSQLRTNCRPAGEDSQISCIKNQYIVPSCERECQCRPIMADETPRNREVCTPRKMKECVLKKVVASGESDVANSTYWAEAKHVCRPSCTEDRFLAYYSFYALEPGNLDHRHSHVRNRFTIFYESTDYLTMIERSTRDDRGMAVRLGGVWIVYTGMSAAAILHSIGLVVVLGCRKSYQFCNYHWRRFKRKREAKREARDRLKDVAVRWRNQVHIDLTL